MHTFEIRVQRRVDDTWPVVTEESEAGVLLPVRTEGGFNLDLDDPALSDPSGCGTVLGKALFQGAILVAFERATARSAGDLHVLLSVEDDRLRALRWERLCRAAEGGWRPLALDQGLPFSRYLPSITDRRFPPIGRTDLRLLVVAASPRDSGAYRLMPFDEAKAVQAVTSALGDRIPADVLANLPGVAGPPTLDALCERITAGSYTLLHLVCHGAYLGQQRPTPAVPEGETVLYLCDAAGGAAPVTAGDLIGRLRSVRGGRGLPQLAFLSTCESAAPEAEWCLGGLGQRLVRELGMPAVVAMTDKIAVDTALPLARAFYGRLCEHGEVDRALAEAFAGLAARPDVALPVPALFGRLGGRPLFSRTSEHALTPGEVARGLDRMVELFRDRAPTVLPELTAKAATVRGLLGVDATELAGEARREREETLAELNGLCGEVLEMSFRALAEGQQPPPYNAACPFRGLLAFRPRDRHFFFGRDSSVDKMISQLADHPFLAVLGGSGSGKSSLVLSGLVPRLVGMKERMFRAFRVITPGAMPDEALRTALAALARHSHGRRSLLVVDQFEEVFTLCGDDARRRQFFKGLLAAAPGVAVVLTMRADFWGDCAPYKALAAEMLPHQVLIAPMDTTDLRRAMEEQAKVVNLRFEAGLADTLLVDVEGEPAAMPLLQHALLELWNRRRGRWLKADAYAEIGGVKGAVAQTAERLYGELAAEDQRRVREIFVRLSQPEDGGPDSTAPRRDTRRRVPMNELIPYGDDPLATRRLVGRLEDRRLVVVDEQDWVEVGHEALIGHWPRLRDWLDADRAGHIIYVGIVARARDWASARRDPNLLDKGARLVTAREWDASHPGELDATAAAFLAASLRAERNRTLAKVATGVILALVVGGLVLGERALELSVWKRATRVVGLSYLILIDRKDGLYQKADRDLGELARTPDLARVIAEIPERDQIIDELRFHDSYWNIMLYRHRPETLVGHIELASHLADVFGQDARDRIATRWRLVDAYRVAGDGKAVSEIEALLSDTALTVEERTEITRDYVWLLASGETPGGDRRETALRRARDEVEAALAKDARAYHPLLLERARLGAMEARWDEAGRDLDRLLNDASGLPEDSLSEAYVLRGFIREAREGDAAGRSDWREGAKAVRAVRAKRSPAPADERRSGVALRREYRRHYYFGVLASLGDDLSGAEAEEEFTRQALVRERIRNDEIMPALENMAKMPGFQRSLHSVMNRMYQSPRGREQARRVILRRISLADWFFNPLTLGGYEFLREDADLAGLSEPLDDVVWRGLVALTEAIAGGALSEEDFVSTLSLWYGLPGDPQPVWAAICTKLRKDPAIHDDMIRVAAYIVGRRLVILYEQSPIKLPMWHTAACYFFDEAAKGSPGDEVARTAQEAKQRMGKCP